MTPRRVALIAMLLASSPGLASADAPPASQPIVPAPGAAPAPPALVREAPAAVWPAQTSPPHLPLAGFSDGVAFLRSPDSTFALLPSGRLQTDAYFFKNPVEPSSYKNTFLVKRARLELFGWIGSRFGFYIAGDFAAAIPAAANPVAASAQSATDDYILVAPFVGRWRDALLFQLGQFDAPFTLENRTSDKYFDLIERSNTVRAFGIPSNKELGLMAHGLLPNKLVYYSLGVFNGDGQNFKNVDKRFDVMGRAWIAPFALLKGSVLDELTVGGSFWVGDRKETLALPAQSTAAGFKYLDTGKWTSAVDTKTPLELHQNGNLRAYAVELDAPIAHRYGARLEFVYKNQRLGEEDVTSSASGKLSWVTAARLKGWSLYGQVWAWVIGDDRIVGRPGLQLPGRIDKMAVQRPRHGLQLIARVERLDEKITSDDATNATGDPLVRRTKLTSLQLGATYWYTKRFRAMFNYDLNAIAGDASGVQKVWSNLNGKHLEHELLLRLAVAL
jgi:phosphate-selective porin